MCPPLVRLVSPCVHLESALAAPPKSCVRHVTDLRQPCVHFESDLAAVPNLVCPLRPWRCFWALSGLGLLCGRGVASSGTDLLHHCATNSVYNAGPLVSFLHKIGLRKSQAHPMLEKLFGVYVGITCVQFICPHVYRRDLSHGALNPPWYL